jgi:hypothetical protein
MTPTLNTPITTQRLKRRVSKSGQYNMVMAMLRRLDKEAGRAAGSNK